MRYAQRRTRWSLQLAMLAFVGNLVIWSYSLVGVLSRSGNGPCFSLCQGELRIVWGGDAVDRAFWHDYRIYSLCDYLREPGVVVFSLPNWDAINTAQSVETCWIQEMATLAALQHPLFWKIMS